MSSKKDSFSIGPPRELAPKPDGGLHEVRDDLGLSLDPKEHADPGCTVCNGKGCYVRIYEKGQLAEPDELVVSPDGKIRVLVTCTCSSRRYQKRRQILKPDMGYPLSVGPKKG